MEKQEGRLNRTERAGTGQRSSGFSSLCALPTAFKDACRPWLEGEVVKNFLRTLQQDDKLSPRKWRGTRPPRPEIEALTLAVLAPFARIKELNFRPVRAPRRAAPRPASGSRGRGRVTSPRQAERRRLGRRSPSPSACSPECVCFLTSRRGPAVTVAIAATGVTKSFYPLGSALPWQTCHDDARINSNGERWQAQRRQQQPRLLSPLPPARARRRKPAHSFPRPGRGAFLQPPAILGRQAFVRPVCNAHQRRFHEQPR